MTLSVIIPTRNRAALWRSGRLLDSLRAQTEPPDELVIALDHTEDKTEDTIREQLIAHPSKFPVRLLDITAARPGPDPASAAPDNCLFAAATGDILVHLADLTHCRGFSLESFDILDPDTTTGNRNPWYTSRRWRIRDRAQDIPGRGFNLHFILQKRP